MADEPTVMLVSTRTHGRVLVRAASPRPQGILVGFHGYAETAAIQLQRLIAIPGAEGWTCVAIQGLHRFYRGRSRETLAGWMTREDRELMIADNIEYVDTVMASMIAKVGPRPIVYTGFSQGVAMAFRSAVSGRQPAAGIVAVGADVPPELLDDAGARFPPVVMIRGVNDEWDTQDKLAGDVAALLARHAEVKSLVVDGAHEWTEAVSREVGHFLLRFAA